MQSIGRGLPETKLILNYVRNGTLTMKASDGTVLQQLGPATRQRMTLSQMPTQLVEAFVASEDADFYQHSGVDFQAIARATLRNVTEGEVVEGGSTITQQLARIVFLDQERSIERKLREAMLARKIEREISKEQILERYLNLVYLGSSAYGVADAAWIYFSKSVNQLTLPEMAMIAGLPPAPSAYSPLVNEELAHRRRDLVLGRMVEAGYITQAEADAAIATPLVLKPSQPRNLYSPYPYFTSYVQQQLPKLIPAEQLEIGGLTVETTMNVAQQTHGQETIQNAIERYGPGQNFGEAALVSIDPRSGEIKSIVGGNDFNESQFNRATQAQRQPGSTFKTLVYTTAIAAGFSPYKPYMDAKLVVDGYEPQNYSRTYSGSMSMREALIKSVNIIAVKALIEVGFDPVIAMSKRMGIQSNLVPAYSLALGSSEVNLLELTSSYGTLANQGNYVQPHAIRRVFDRFGNEIYRAQPEAQRAVDADTAAIMTWMLRGVVSSGTGGNAAIDRPVAGKTGTSENRRDLWFIGYVPQLVTGVWLGNDNNRPTYGASSTAARVWRNYMGDIVDGMEVEPFPELPRLRGREGSIEAEPIKPRRMRADTAPTRNSEDEEASTPARSRRRSSASRIEESAPVEPRRRRRQAAPVAEEAPAPARRSQRRQAAPVQRSAPAPEPAAPAPVEAAPKPIPAAPPAASEPAPGEPPPP
ncbi:penicillin-binding protein 1A [Microcoleus sp. FACHB-1515]|nr:penicillin-binding protein 1A [Microcoleus sp. FACHB-1515]